MIAHYATFEPLEVRREVGFIPAVQAALPALTTITSLFRRKKKRKAAAPPPAPPAPPSAPILGIPTWAAVGGGLALAVAVAFLFFARRGRR